MLRLPKFDYHEPHTIPEACRVMMDFGAKAKPIAGGTDLMVNMKKQLISPEHVVSLSKIDALKGIELTNGTVRIGSCVTVVELIESDVINRILSALATGARSLGSPLVRNLATIGGNVASARPAADLPPSLMGYNASVVLSNTSGERTVSLDKFFRGPGLTEMAKDELLTRIDIPVPAPFTGAGYIQIGVRKAQDCNLVNVGSCLVLDKPDGTIQSARIILGCVGPTHLRASSAEKILIGEKPCDAIFEKAAQFAMNDCSPIDDFRGSAIYKKNMVGVLTQRTLQMAYKEAQNRNA